MMQTPKILYCASTDSHLQRFHLPYINALSEKYRVSLLGNGTLSDYSIPFSKHFFSFSNFKAYFKILRVLKREGFDVILTHTSMASFLVRLALKGKCVRPKVLVTVHGYLFADPPHSIRDRVLLLCEKAVRKETDAIAVMNQEDLAIARRNRLTKGPVFLIKGMGVPNRLLPAEKIALRDRCSIKKEEILLAYVGELSKRKNQIFLIRALARLREDGLPIRLLLLGKGEERSRLEREAETLGIFSCVIFMGECRKVHAYLQEVDLYACASRCEGLPFNLLEAMQEGLPVLASEVKGHADLLKNNRDLLYPLDDMKAFCEKVKRICKNGALGVGTYRYKGVSEYQLSEVFTNNLKILEGWGELW